MNDPVIVLDGKLIDKIDNLNSDHIEKIEVLKDPDHELVKKYNAKDGLILITSKKGHSAPTKKTQESFQKNGELFYIVEDMPMFPGGKAALKSYIHSRLQYPESAKKKGIQGEVQVQFVVSATGKVEDVQVVHSTYQGFDEPAMKVFQNMPDWKPGTQRGKPVNVQVVVPVRFNPDME
jgi:TonB family protein